MKIWYMPNQLPRPSDLKIDSLRRVPRRFIALFIVTCIYLLGIGFAESSVEPPKLEREEEIYLSFRYRGGIDAIIIAYRRNDQYFLPVTELFNLLSIDYTVDPANLSITGFYLDPATKYELGFLQRIARLGEKQLNFTASDFLIKDIDFYVQPLLLKTLFGLDFSVDISRLVLSLETDKVLPIVERYERRTKHRKGMLTSVEVIEAYPLIAGRDKQVISGYFIDYSLYGYLSEEGQITSYNLSGGGEFLAGDIQGDISGTTTSNIAVRQYSDLHWRYVLDRRNLLSAISLGQLNSTGLNSLSYTGISFTNESIEPRQSFADFIVEGTTLPESDVELYQNNRLVDFHKADESGYYRFTVPLKYGTADLKLKIYGPTGGVIESAKRIQIPYTFLPAGTINYFLGIGKQQKAELAWNNQNILSQFHISAGLTKWLTNKIGVDFVEGENQNRPLFYNSLSARIALQYLLNLDIAPNVSNKMTLRVLYPSAKSWSIDYTDYKSGGYLNKSNLKRALTLNTYLPFSVKSFQQTARFSIGKSDYQTSSRLTYNIDYSIFVRRVRLGAKYRDVLQYSSGDYLGNAGKFSLLAMYTIPRTPNVNKFLRGTYFRTEIKSKVNSREVHEVELQVLKQISNAGRLQLSYSYDFQRQFRRLELGLNFDFNSVRSSSRIRSSGGRTSFSETVRGSIAIDGNNHELVYDNRHQVGRSGISVRMYVDQNDSGIYEKNERIIPGNAVRLLNSSSRQITKSGISRLTQLLPYRRYNFIINEAYIRDPILVPMYKEFAVVTDPNRYKQLDVPFYITGIIEGQVIRRGESGPEPIGGLRLYLEGVDNQKELTLHTFSDGSFYAMEIPPGSYEISVDSAQLLFLNAVSAPEKHYFEIKAIAEGDFVESLNFILIKR